MMTLTALASSCGRRGSGLLKRYSLFPSPAQTLCHRGKPPPPASRSHFLYRAPRRSHLMGELYAAWDADRTLRARTPYIIHNLATSFRLTSSNSVRAPQHPPSRPERPPGPNGRCLPTPTTNRWYIISLEDGPAPARRAGNLDLAPVGTVDRCGMDLPGPDSKGYYYIGNPAGAHNSQWLWHGSVCHVWYGGVRDAEQQHPVARIKPYQPVSSLRPQCPSPSSGHSGNQTVTLSLVRPVIVFTASIAGNRHGRPYTRIATPDKHHLIATTVHQ